MKEKMSEMLEETKELDKYIDLSKILLIIFVAVTVPLIISLFLAIEIDLQIMIGFIGTFTILMILAFIPILIVSLKIKKILQLMTKKSKSASEMKIG